MVVAAGSAVVAVRADIVGGLLRGRGALSAEAILIAAEALAGIGGRSLRERAGFVRRVQRIAWHERGKPRVSIRPQFRFVRKSFVQFSFRTNRSNKDGQWHSFGNAGDFRRSAGGRSSGNFAASGFSAHNGAGPGSGWHSFGPARSGSSGAAFGAGMGIAIGIHVRRRQCHRLALRRIHLRIFFQPAIRIQHKPMGSSRFNSFGGNHGFGNRGFGNGFGWRGYGYRGFGRHGYGWGRGYWPSYGWGGGFFGTSFGWGWGGWGFGLGSPYWGSYWGPGWAYGWDPWWYNPYWYSPGRRTTIRTTLTGRTAIRFLPTIRMLRMTTTRSRVTRSRQP